ncbi:ribbon-helix-helix domain-containing protein [Kitasatospora indigofera]|uniref:ribbon-helix-helix domain-containing protein n=1 Tax=Kitasatospora indigofera TaxID=67307 RepID=UPI003699D7B5
MHRLPKEPAQTGNPAMPPDKKVIGGITLYGPQLAKLNALAATGTSRSAAIRQLIDEHL